VNSPVAVALVHHPVLGRQGELLTTTVTNLDVHDIARSVRSYGLDALYIVHPLESQQQLSARILRHWVGGAGGKRIPDRGAALERVRIVPSLEAARSDLGEGTVLWTTAARALGGELTSFVAARERLATRSQPLLITFGTGWGLPESLLSRAAVRLEPITAAADTGYNHLSVRAASAIVLDRLFGARG